MMVKAFLFAAIFFIAAFAAKPTTNFELIKEANERQKEFETQWNDLLNENEIVKATEKIGKTDRPLFQMTGDKVKEMKVQDVFGMLQNWPLIDPLVDGKSKPQSQVELKIGGKDFKFRISTAPFGEKQTLIKNSEKNFGLDYKQFFDIVASDHTKFPIKEVAKFMLEASRAKINDDRDWEKDFTFLNEEVEVSVKSGKNVIIHKVKFGDLARELMVITQVAEPTRPTDESFGRLKGAIDDITKIVIETRQTVWKKNVEKLLSSSYGIKGLEKDFDFEKFYSLADILSVPGADHDNAKQEILKLIGEDAEKKISNKEKFYDELKETANGVRKKELAKFKAKAKPLKLTGRVPYADEVFRQILETIQNQPDSEALFKEHFDRLFLIKEKTIDGRYDMLFNNHIGKRKSDDSDGASGSGDSSAPDTKKQKTDDKNVNLVAATKGDHDKTAITDQVTDTLNKGGACKVALKKRSTCKLKYKLIDDSITLKDDTATFKVQDEDGFVKTHEIKIDTSKLSTPQYTKEQMALSEEIKTSPVADSFGKGIGGYGAIVNILGSAQYFANGDYGKGAFSLSQAAHAIGGLTGINEVVSKFTKKAFQKVMSYTVEKIGIEKTLEKLSEAGAKALGETASRALGRLGEALPFVGLAFDLYFVAEDIKDIMNKNDTTPLGLKVTHLVLDVTLTVLSLVEIAAPEAAPFIEPFVIALTIVRLTIDDFYNDISYELSQVKGKSFGDKVVAFFKGFEEGIADVFTLGLVSQLRELDQQKAYDRELLSNLSNPASYFKVSFTGQDANGNEVGTVDLTAGILSQYGGFMTVKLNDDDSFTVTLPEVPTEGGGTTTITKTIRFDKPINDIVLGVGQVETPRYTQKTAKLWFFIPVETADVINGFDEHQSSRYGVYHGNEENNNFYTLQGKRRRKRFAVPSRISSQFARQQSQTCPVSSSTDETVIYLQSYHYDLYGGGGNDKFFLGSQTSRASGDEGNDLYYLQPDGGKAVINNFALDEEQDTIFLNVSHENIHCFRTQWDLFVTYCGTHEIQLKNWFVHGNEEYYRHIYIVTNDGIGIEVTETAIDQDDIQANCKPVSVDKSRSKQGEVITLGTGFENVKQVTGSNFTDTIVGNNLANTIRGGLGNDYLEGANGSDVYVIKRGDGMDEINNFSEDKKDDNLVFGVDYINIQVTKHNLDLVLSDSTNTQDTSVTLKSWYMSTDYQHLTMISKDYVRFVIGQNTDGTPRTISMTVDFGGYAEGVTVDLQSATGTFNYLNLNDELKKDIKTVLDSKHSDNLKANVLGNFLTCSGGDDYLEGRGGKDVYVIDPSCNSVTINNYDTQQDFDLILFKCLYQNIRVVRSTNDLKLECNNDQKTRIVMKNWFVSDEYQHCHLKTSDKVTTFLPKDDSELSESQGLLFPVEIESDEDCNGESKHIDLRAQINKKVERFTAKTDKCSFNITGNNNSNYIDPGPGNPFGYQELIGGNGTDTYIIGHKYGTLNIIDNYAEDEAIDHLMFNVLFHDIKIVKQGTDVLITSLSRNDSVRVTLKDYFAGELYQHILIHSVDNVAFLPSETQPYIEIKMMDFSDSPFSQVINVTDSTTKIITGSAVAQNHITSGSATTKVTGGNEDDTVIGGPSDEDIFGLEGNDHISGGGGSDYIFGGDGDDMLYGGDDNDAIYGGQGADTIDGGEGSDYIAFSGYNFTGVSVNLQIGLGWGSDAEGDKYTSIENILATEYDDFLVGNDEDNFLIAYGGSDYIVPGGGRDVMQGGTGNDFYDLRNSFGRKIIDNFATDSLQDLVIINGSNSSSVCYFYLDTDLDMHVNFDNNTAGNFRRVSADEDFLHIKISFIKRNTTYQHISFALSDAILEYPVNFSENGKQLYPLFKQIVSGHVLSVTKMSSTSLLLTFNFTDLGSNPPTSSNYKLEYVHIQYKTTKYTEIAWPSQGGLVTQTINNVVSGYEHKFIVYLTSCSLVVATSQAVTHTTEPSPPSGLTISGVVFDGFTLSWTPPSSQTDPFVSQYQYTITLRSPHDGRVEIVANVSGSSYTTYDLLPETDYIISIASSISNIIGLNSDTVQARTGENNCGILIDIPRTLKIERFDIISGILHATVYCIQGYRLVGNPVVECNGIMPLPTCQHITCPIPVVSNAVIVTRRDAHNILDCSSTAYYNCIYFWNCKVNYEIDTTGSNSFSSTCGETEWSPPLQVCNIKPSCSGLNAPLNGRISSTSVYVGEHIYFTCNSGYQLQGPSSSECVRGTGNTASCVSSILPTCLQIPCPSLLPQPNGVYSQHSTPLSTGDSVTLTCNNGYYIRDVVSNPEQQVLRCLGGMWDITQTHCQRSIEVINVEEKVLVVKGTPRYTFSSWAHKSIDSSLYPQACSMIGGSYASIQSSVITCNRQYSLVGGPNSHTGILQVSTSKGKEKVCVTSNDVNVQTICNNLGYSQYTRSIVTIGSQTTTLTIQQSLHADWRLTSQQQSCNKAIQCRAKCPDLNLLNGNDCYYTLEGQTCNFQCNSGHLLVGSASRTCTGNGQWTGTHPFCDCK